MRRLLVIAYFFPPVSGVGVQRTLKHVTYLPSHGWKPVVVAPANPGYRLVDPASVALIPADTEVHRARGIEPAHLRRAMGSLLRASQPGDSATPSEGPASAGMSREGPLARLRRAANAAWSAVIPLVFFPDDMVLWVGGAVRAGQRAHERSPVDAIYSSSPPVSDHLAAGILAGRLGLPWIADFRDPWIGNAYARPLPATHRAIQRRVERWIVERAARVAVATEAMRRVYVARYPELALRFVHIPNGYDPADLDPRDSTFARSASDEGTFHLVHAGSVYGNEAFSIFLDGVERLLERDPASRDRLRVEFVGWFSEASQAIARHRLPALEPVVRQTGYVQRDEAIAIQRSADAGLLVLHGGGDRSLFATTKLYEYLGLGLPVLAVVPPGEVREILEELDWGVYVDPTAAGVADGIERIMAAGRPGRTADPERRYERGALAARLAAQLDAVVITPED